MASRTPLGKQDRQSRLIGLFLLSVLLFNFPILGILGKGEKWGSIPGLLVYLGTSWAILILLLFVTMRDIPAGSGPHEKRPGE